MEIKIEIKISLPEDHIMESSKPKESNAKSLFDRLSEIDEAFEQFLADHPGVIQRVLCTRPKAPANEKSPQSVSSCEQNILPFAIRLDKETGIEKLVLIGTAIEITLTKEIKEHLIRLLNHYQ